MATTDRLTGAANREAFELVFEQLRRGARRRRSPVSLLSLDVDHFKAVDDRYGHHAGDVALRSLVGRIRAQIREADTIARWGGEEFVILLADCDLEDALRRAERLRGHLGGEEIRHAGRPGARPDRGLRRRRRMPATEEPLESVMQRVDSALDAAKRGGRDRCSGPEGVPLSRRLVPAVYPQRGNVANLPGLHRWRADSGGIRLRRPWG
ncbi:MAG: GGDEF domain-containing protein [Arhodomonas sp.]|nr:GGDEF domain-containing protein [Arhodomonas sp.]